jgi:hypothetical protein
LEQRGKGAASAVVVSNLEMVDAGTKVTMETDLTISGAVAQYGRGMMVDISQRLTKEFARCLEANILAAGTSSPEPVKGFRLGLWAFWRAAARLFRRLFGGDAG